MVPHSMGTQNFHPPNAAFPPARIIRASHDILACSKGCTDQQCFTHSLCCSSSITKCSARFPLVGKSVSMHRAQRCPLGAPGSWCHCVACALLLMIFADKRSASRSASTLGLSAASLQARGRVVYCLCALHAYGCRLKNMGCTNLQADRL